MFVFAGGGGVEEEEEENGVATDDNDVESSIPLDADPAPRPEPSPKRAGAVSSPQRTPKHGPALPPPPPRAVLDAPPAISRHGCNTPEASAVVRV